MRIIIAPYMGIVLSTTLLFLITAPQESCANPLAGLIAVVSGAVKVLGPAIQSYLGDLRAIKDAEEVEVRVWMHTGIRYYTGCGLWFGVTGHSGNNVSDWFPPVSKHKCGSDERYVLRLTSQSAMYSKKLRLGNDQVKEIQIHADGWRDTFVKMMCFGLGERTIAGGPRAFCIDNDILKSCKALTRKWVEINLDWNNIKLTRTNRGPHKIIFKDVEKLIRAFEAIDRNPDDADAVQKVCDQIELKAGENSDKQTCLASAPLFEGYIYTPYPVPPLIIPPAGIYALSHKNHVNPDSCQRFG